MASITQPISNTLATVSHIWYTCQFHQSPPWLTWSGSLGQSGVYFLPIYHIQHENPLLAKFTLSVIINHKLLTHCLYLPPSLDSETVQEILTLLPMSYHAISSTFICGDFNARMGDNTGDTRFNSRGHLFWNWLQSHQLTLWNSRLSFGQPTYYAYQGNSIIDYFISDTELQSPHMTIRDDLSLSSYHKFMSISFDLPQPPHHAATDNLSQRLQWNIHKLKKIANWEKYRSTFTTNLANLALPPKINSLRLENTTMANTYIEQLCTNLCELLYETIDEVCGKKDFWTPEMTEAHNLKESYYAKYGGRLKV